MIHHVNQKRSCNENGNLVVCQDNAYHKLLHQRTRALLACGHADWRKCNVCKQYDASENMYVSGDVAHHRYCKMIYYRRLKLRRREANG